MNRAILRRQGGRLAISRLGLAEAGERLQRVAELQPNVGAAGVERQGVLIERSRADMIAAVAGPVGRAHQPLGAPLSGTEKQTARPARRTI